MPYEVKEGSAKNKDSAKKLYEERSKYRINSLDLPNFSDESSFLDMWYERPLYGRADTRGNIVIPMQKSTLDQVPGSKSVFAVDFVAAAFVEMRDHLVQAIARSQFPATIGPIKKFHAKRAWSDADALYEAHLDRLKENFINSYLIPNEKKIIRPMHIAAYLEEYVERNAAQHPMTFSGFVGSKLCPPHCSGLVIDLVDKDHGSDEEKLEVINSPFFKNYVNVANKFGFYVNKNAPWSLIANLESSKMRSIMAEFGVRDSTRYYFSYCVKAYEMDVKKIQDFVFDIYYAFTTSNPMIKDSEVCKNNRLKKINTKRKMLTLPQLRDSIPTKYWLRLYFLMRCHETRSTVSAAESKRLLKVVNMYLRRDGNIKRGIKKINLFFKTRDRRISPVPYLEYLESLSKEELSSVMASMRAPTPSIPDIDSGVVGHGDGEDVEDQDLGLLSKDETNYRG